MADKIFVNGLRVQKPRDNAPDFVKANVSINRAELITWLESQTGEWVNGKCWIAKTNPARGTSKSIRGKRTSSHG